MLHDLDDVARDDSAVRTWRAVILALVVAAIIAVALSGLVASLATGPAVDLLPFPDRVT